MSISNFLELISLKMISFVTGNRSEALVEFEVFREQTESFWVLSIGSLLFDTLVILYYMYLVYLTYMHEELTEDSFVSGTIITYAVFSVVLGFLSVSKFIIKLKMKQNIEFATNIYWILSRNYIRSLSLIGITILFSLRLLSRTIYGACPYKEEDWYCNPVYDQGSLPLDTVLALCILPLTASVVLNNDWLTALVSWAMIVVVLIASVVLADKGPQSAHLVTLLVFYVPASFILIYSNERSFKAMYGVNRQLKSTLAENEKLAEEARATELRSMIGNVAHDLKTPIMSLMNGLELIDEAIDEIPKISENSLSTTKDTLEENLKTIKTYIDNMRDVNSFMTMTINRCIDFTKASKGFALIPKVISIDLMNTIALPVKIMRNFQSRVKIFWNETLEKDICSHIFTDQQWLQENLLCLLSNAVKFSNKGNVELWMEKVEFNRLKKNKNKVNKKIKPSDHYQQDNNTKEKLQIQKIDIKASPVNSPYEIDQKMNKTSSTDIDHHLCRDLENNMGKYMLNIDNESDSNSKGKDKSKNPFSILSGRISSFRNKNTNAVAPEEFLENKIENKYYSNSQDEENQLISGFSPELCVSEVLRFTVMDSGAGLSEEAMKTLFSPFKQAERLAGGTGLGLFSLAKRLEALNGSYGVKKRVDGKPGCVFWFDIPYKPDIIAEENSLSHRIQVKKHKIPLDKSPRLKPLYEENIHIESTKTPALSRLSTFSKSSVFLPSSNPPLRVLLVDDSLAICKMTTMILEKQGHHVTVAENGLIALEKGLFLNNPTGLLGCPFCLQVLNEQSENHEKFDKKEKEKMNLNEAGKSGKSDAGSISTKVLNVFIKPSGGRASLTNNSSKYTDYQCNYEKYPPFDVILLDLQMPVMNGLEMTKNWRNLENSLCDSHGFNRGKQKIIGISANSDDVTRMDALRVGMDDFISKPFSIDQFYKTLQKIKSENESKIDL